MLTVDLSRLNISAGHRVLDIGCGFGRHSYGAAALGATVVACDLAILELKEVLATAFAMERDKQLPDSASVFSTAGDCTKLPFENSSFDCVIASEVLEHIPNDTQAMQELARVLKPGGTLAVTVPSFMPEKICWMLSDEYYSPKAEGGHIRIYSKTEIVRKLNGVGFKTEFSHNAHALHSPYWWLRCFVGPSVEDNRLIKAYHKFLCWDIMKNPAWVSWLEKALNPLMGKSLVVYAQKPFKAQKSHTREFLADFQQESRKSSGDLNVAA